MFITPIIKINRNPTTNSMHINAYVYIKIINILHFLSFCITFLADLKFLIGMW